MGQSPNPLNRRTLSRAGIAGAVLAMLGIGLFVLLWVVLGSLEVGQIARLLLSLCIPPAVIAAIVGAYFLLVQPGGRKR